MVCHCHVFTDRRHLHHPVQVITKAMAVAELRSLPALHCYYCLLWRSHIWNAMRWCEHSPDLPSGFEHSSGLSASTCVPMHRCPKKMHSLGLALQHILLPWSPLNTWMAAMLCCHFTPQNQKHTHSQPSIYACCCLSIQGSLDSWVSLFFLTYLLLFDVQAFICGNNEESSVWGRKAQFKIFLGERVGCQQHLRWRMTAGQLLFSSWSLAWRWLKGSWMNDFLVLVTFVNPV